MRISFSLWFLLTAAIASAQGIDVNSAEIAKEEYENCKTAQPTLLKAEGWKETLVFDKIKFEVLGTFQGLDSFMFMRSIPDSFYYLMNKSTGYFDRLPGYPIFSSNPKLFACLGDLPREREIIIFEAIDNKLAVIFRWSLFKEVNEIRCISYNSFMAKETSGKLWRFVLKRH